MQSASYFNSCLYMRGNAKAAGAKVRKSNFNSRLYMRGNSSFKNKNRVLNYFNSRLYMRGNRYFAGLQQVPPLFQFTPLHERQPGVTCGLYQRTYFNSRLYMRGNERFLDNLAKGISISIHASTWEATRGDILCTRTQGISIHASTWEATVL